MKNPTLTTQLSNKELRFQPGGQPVSFEVKVINTSEQFATFQVKVVAAGVETTAGDYWYRLSPEVSAKTPPGDTTSFSITILNTPNPGFVGTMNLFVQIHCLELRQEARELLRLKLEPSKTPIPLKLELGNRSLMVRSLESLEIPVTVVNLAQFPVEALLRCTGLDPSWLPEGNERRVALRAGGQGKTQFFCQIPPPSQGASGIYPFTVEALQQGNSVSQADGVIQLIPGGMIEFNISPKEQQIPEKRRWWPNWRANTASYSLLLTNEGNVRQQITAQGTPEPDQPQGKLQVEPGQMDLEIGTTAEMALWVKHKRPWWGRAKQCAYEVKAVVLSEPALPIRKDTHRVKLRLQPLLPLWMQGVGTLALLWLLWWLSWLNPSNPFWGHRDGVNSVRFNGIGDDLISGSSDKSMIAWRVDGFFNPFLNQHMGKIGTTGDRAVRVLRYRPVNNDRVAVGLENGEIQIWSSLTGNKAPIQTFFAQKDDRVLDLAFSQDARQLFSAHGSGTVVQWNLDLGGGSLTSPPRIVRKTNVGFPIYGIALVGHPETHLAIAGRHNRVALLHLKTDRLRNVSVDRGSQLDYILSLATADQKRTLLATANNRGQIQLWSLQPCLNSTARCELLDQWTADTEGVRAVALSADGCYLASGGESGKTMLWPLNPRGDRSSQFPQGQALNQSSQAINTVDILRVRDEILVARGGDDTQVSLYRTSALSSTCP